MPYDDDLRLAHVLADAVEQLTMARFRAADLRVETKPDLTPVSDADRAAEELVRAQLARTRPRDAVVGEEFGTTGHGPRRWIIDPIDGTKNFVRGVPVWATLIALVDGDDPGLPETVTRMRPAGLRGVRRQGTPARYGSSWGSTVFLSPTTVIVIRAGSRYFSAVRRTSSGLTPCTFLT